MFENEDYRLYKLQLTVALNVADFAPCHHFKMSTFRMGNENLNEFSLISQALDDGLDLREYSQKINGKLTKAEEDIVQGFLDNSEKTVQLHLKVKSCDSILERVESMLEGFQVPVKNVFWSPI